MIEIRERKVRKYVNDLCSYTSYQKEAVFSFTVDELESILYYIPEYDLLHQDIREAIDELRKYNDGNTDSY